ncbi:sugar phosphate isomerase/epimerase [Patescibacteria group bacterium]|nr:sugar phosphate isomerase/epimerase [Patescibacteria group bacterium]
MKTEANHVESLSPQPIHLVEFISALSTPRSLLFNFIAKKPQFLNRQNFHEKVNQNLFSDKGFTDIELGLWTGGFFDANWNVRKEAVELFKKSGFSVPSFHGCFDLFPKSLRSVFLNLASSDPANVKSLKSQIDVASEISRCQKPFIVFHAGFVDSHFQKKEGFSNIKRSFEKVLPYAEKKGVILTLENIFWKPERVYLGVSPREIVNIVDTFKSPHLKVTFDWGHANCLAKATKAKNNFVFIDDFIKELGLRITHAHLSYNEAYQDKRTPLRLWQQVLKKIPYWSRDIKSVKIALADDEDTHLSLSTIPEEKKAQYAQNLKTLVQETSLASVPVFTHEVISDEIRNNGATIQMYEDDIKFVNQSIK